MIGGVAEDGRVVVGVCHANVDRYRETLRGEQRIKKNSPFSFHEENNAKGEFVKHKRAADNKCRACAAVAVVAVVPTTYRFDVAGLVPPPARDPRHNLRRPNQTLFGQSGNG